jgi:DNA-binding MurR/RpiR family transcriptional regulator
MWEHTQKATTIDDVAELAGVSKPTAAKTIRRIGRS